MTFTEEKKRLILLCLIAIIIIGFITAKFMANKQDEKFVAEDSLYQQSAQLYNEGNYAEAASSIHKVLKANPNSEVVNYLGGLIAANNDESKKAAILLKKSLDINPYKVEDPLFMLQLGEILWMADRNEDAKVVLTQCQKAAWAPNEYPDYQARVAELLTEIGNM